MGSIAQWSNLPKDILAAIANLLDTEDNLLCLRAVCSHWRSSLSHLTSSSPLFPVKIPPPETLLIHWEPDDRRSYFVLRKSTVYRLHPPSGEGKGWMFKVCETGQDPRIFSLRVLLSMEKMKAPTESFPKTLSRLDYRISNICTSYSVELCDLGKPKIVAFLPAFVRRTILLQNYVQGCDFVVIVLNFGGKLDFWRFGDVKWSHIGADKDYRFDDIVLYDGKCYAIDYVGRLVIIDSALNAREVTTSSLVYDPSQRNYMVVGLDSELYVVRKMLNSDPEMYFDDEIFEMDERTVNMPIRLIISKLDKKKLGWDYVSDLGDQVFFLGDDVTFCVSSKDFDGCKTNCVYLTDECFFEYNEGSVYGEDTGLYDYGSLKGVALAYKEEHAKFYWPPPSWLMVDDMCSSERCM